MYEIATQQAYTCLKRLVDSLATELYERPAELQRAFSRFPLLLLEHALKALPKDVAVRLITEEDLRDFVRRVQVVEWLVDEETPFLTLGELTRHTERFRDYLRLHAPFLIQTGLPPRSYDECRWLYLNLGRLYDTRATSSPWPRDVLHHLTRPSPGCPSRPVRLSPYTWIKMPAQAAILGRDITACEYHEADYLKGMHQEAADRIELSREKLLNTKLRLLDILIDPAMKRDSGKVWPNFVKLLAASFTPGDIEFFFYMDRFYLGTDARYGSDVNPDPKMVPGGLTNWIDVLGHFEKEIRFGTLARTKAAMLPALFQKLTTASEGGHEYRWAYLNVVGSAEQARLDAILRQLFLRLDEEKKFWPEFRHRVNSSLSCEFLVPVTVYVPFAIVDGISSFLQQRADQMFEHWPAPAAPAVTSQQVKRIAAKFPAPEGLKWSEVTIEFVSNDSLRFTARGVQKRYTYTELGFKDGRKGDLPDTSWEFLKLMAEHNGDSSKATAASQVLKHKATKKVQAINKRLKELTGLSERPISWSRGDSKYRIAFNFHKNTLQKNLANSSKEEPEEREDPKED